MDQNATTPTEEQPPTAAHFREAARLAAARVREALGEGPDADNLVPFESPTPEHFQAHARADAEEQSPAPQAPKQEQVLCSNLDERLQLGARMLRAFESQIARLEAAASKNENAESPTANGASSQATHERITTACAAAEERTTQLETLNSEAHISAEALASGLETAQAVKTLLEDSIEGLAHEARGRDVQMQDVIDRADSVLEQMQTRLQEIETIEHAMTARLQAIEDIAATITALTKDAVESAQERVTRELARFEVGIERHIATADLPDAPIIEIEPDIVESITPPRERTNVPDVQPLRSGSIALDEDRVRSRLARG